MLNRRITTCALVFLGFLMSVGVVAQTTRPPQPKTPSEAVVSLQEQLNEAGQSGNLTGVEERQKQRAAEYAALFRTRRWQGKELLSLVNLYLSAEQYTNAETASLEYLKSPEAVEAKRARTSLLSAYLGEKKYAAGLPVAEALVAEKVYDYDLVSGVQRLIEALRPSQPRQAVMLAEKMLPNLFPYFQSKSDIPPVLVAQQVGAAYDYGLIYRELGEASKADAYSAAFMAQFNASSLASNKIFQKAIDAAMLRLKVYGTAVPSMEVLQYVETPRVNLPDLKGKVVMLDFFAHWCVECIQDIPSVNRLQEKYAARGLVVLGVTKYYGFFGERQGISQDEELAALKSLKAQQHLNYGLLVTPPQVEAQYGVAALPTIVLIDKKGMVRLVDTGYNEQRVEQVIADLLKEVGEGSAQ